MSVSQKETVSMTSKQHYGKDLRGSAPENYEQFFVPVIGKPLARELVDLARLRAGERVLDVACGTGIGARLAAERVGSSGAVVGIDVNPGMLAVARTVSKSNGLSIEWYESAAETLPLPDNSFDAVLCNLSLQFFQDKPAAVREMWRVAARDGRVLIGVPGKISPVFVTMADALATHIAPELAGFVHQVFSLYDPDELERLLTGAGFREVRIFSEPRTLRLPAPKEFLWQYVNSTPMAQALNGASDESLAAVEQDVVAAWQAFVEDDTFMYPQDIILATAHKILA